MKKKTLSTVLVNSFLVLLGVLFLIEYAKPISALAQMPKTKEELPERIVFISHPIGSVYYSASVGLADAITKMTGMKGRVEPRGATIEKMAALKSGEAQLIYQCPNYTYFAYMGLEEFSTAEWGPLPFRTIFRGGPGTTGLFCRGDSKIKTWGDVKGKKVTYYPGQAPLNYTVGGALAFGGLTWNDVIQVKTAGYTQGIQAVLDGSADVSYAAPEASLAYQVEASHGIHWLEEPRKDKEGWARVHKIAPFDFPHKATRGAGISEKSPKEIFDHPYELMCLQSLSDNLVYVVTKVVVEGYNLYKGVHPVLSDHNLDLALDLEILPPFPYHPGAIKYFKEIGRWTPAMEKWQEDLLKKEAEYVKTWKPRGK